MTRERYKDERELTDTEILAIAHIWRRWRPTVCVYLRRLSWMIAILTGTTFTSWWHHLLGPILKSVIPS